jgi:hypothetical protein
MADAAEQLLVGTGWLPALLRLHAPTKPLEQHDASPEACSVPAE